MIRNSLALVVLLSCASAAFAQDGSIPILQKGLVDSLNQVFTILQNVAIKWLGVFMILQFTWTNWHLLMNDADITKVIAKFAGSIFWFCICIYIFHNGSDFLKNVSNGIMNLATGATGVEFDPIQPIKTGISVASQLLETLDGTQSILESFNIFPAIMMGLVSVVILAVSAVLAFKILMVFIETKMVIALSPLSFALLGLNAFRDQGLAPFKYLVSMGIRMFLYGAVLAAMGIFSSSIIEAFKALPAASDPSVWPPIWAAAMGYVLLGAVALRVDSIAVMLASGSSQMSTGDAAAVGAVAGAAAGIAAAAAAPGVGKASGAAKSGGQSMADFMKSMGSSSTISNAGLQGGAGGVLKPDAAQGAQSMASQGGGGKSAIAPPTSGAQQAGPGMGGLPDPRARPARSPNTNGGGAGVLGMASTGASEAAVPRPTTSSWKDSDGVASQVSGSGSPAGGAMDMPGSGTSDPSVNGSPTTAPVRSGDSPRSGRGTPADTGGGDSFGADLKKEMTQSQASETAQQSTPRRPPVTQSAGTSGETAGIGGSSGADLQDLKMEMARLADLQAKQAGPRKPTLSDEIARAGQQTENAAPVQIQMNTHQGD